MSEQRDRVVLAYSGGLDTSVCIKWMQEERGLDVIAVVGDVGQEHDGLEKIHDKALRTGAIECGVLEDPWNEPPADIYTMTTDPEKAPIPRLSWRFPLRTASPARSMARR